MTDIWKTPIGSSTNVHHAERFRLLANGVVNGAFTLGIINDGYEGFSLCVFTDDSEFAADLAIAVSAVCAKHNRLAGQPDRVTEAA